MTSRIHYLLRAASTMAAVGIMAVCASAEQFKIDVPLEASWNNIVLPAGEYRITEVPGMNALRVSGNGKSVTLLVSAIAPDDPKITSHLQIINGGDIPAVSELSSQTTGMTYRFFVHRNVKQVPQETIALAKSSLR